MQKCFDGGVHFSFLFVSNDFKCDCPDSRDGMAVKFLFRGIE